MNKEGKFIKMKNVYLKRDKILKLLLFFFLSSSLVFFYFSFLTVVTTDSTIYYRYLEILKGNIPLGQWNVVRGPTMPIIIYTITKIFGDNILGFTLGTFVFFITAIATAYSIISNILLTQSNKTIKVITWILFILLFVFNPLIIGYYHVMLTEFVAMTFALITISLSIKWISIDPLKQRTKYITYSLLFILISISMWFLKQPYVIVAIIPISLATILSIFKLRNRSNTILKVLISLLCIVGVVGSIKIWDQALLKKGNIASREEAESYLADGLIDAVSNFRETERGKNEEYRKYDVLSVFRNKAVDTIVIQDIVEDPVSMKDTLLFLKTVTIKYPEKVVMSYVANYASLINLFPYYYKSFNSQKRFFKPEELRGENESIGLAIYSRDSTFLGGATEKRASMSQYEMGNPSKALSPIIIKTLTSLYPIYLLTATLLISPVFFVVLLIIYLTNKPVRNGKKTLLYESLILLFGYSSLHVLFHAITGARVDRYSIVAYPTAIVGTILLLNFIRPKK